MTKLFYPIITDDFKKCLKKDFDKKRIQKIIERLQDLEKAENEFISSGNHDRTKLNQFGKTLSKSGHKDIYSLELGMDRFLAKVVETDDCKYYVFYWGGSHEKYNNTIKNLDTNKPREETTKEEISKVAITIKNIREKALGSPSNHSCSYTN